MLFFFFKQKTAYEMRISDWSSDVCSSDLVRSGGGDDRFRQTLRAARLQKLRRLGLAEEIAPRRWRLVDDLEQVLRRIGERGDIIKTLHREMVEKGIARSATDYAIYDPADANAWRVEIG